MEGRPTLDESGGMSVHVPNQLNVVGVKLQAHQHIHDSSRVLRANVPAVNRVRILNVTPIFLGASSMTRPRFSSTTGRGDV